MIDEMKLFYFCLTISACFFILSLYFAVGGDVFALPYLALSIYYIIISTDFAYDIPNPDPSHPVDHL